MKNSKIKILAVTLAAACFGLVSCGGGSAESSSESLVAGKIVIADGHPTEIAVAQTLNLEDYVTVTKVDTWTITTKDTTVVQIDGHNIIGLELGDFTVTVVAGKTKKAYNGSVVSDEKIAFNTFLDSIDNNYTAYCIGGVDSSGSPVTTNPSTYATVSYIGHAGSYIYQPQGYTDSTKAKIGYTGIIDAPDSNAYNFSIQQKVSDESYVNFSVDPGLQYGIDANGYGDVSITGAQFAQDKDKDGNLIESYSLTDSAYDDYNTVLDNFLYLSLGFGTSVIENNWGAVAGVTAFQAVDSNEQPVDGTWDLQFFTSTGYLPVLVEITDVGTSNIAAVDAWIKTPTYPTAIDGSAIVTAARDLFTSKKATAHFSAQWINTETGKTVKCPFVYSDTKEDILYAFDEIAYFNETSVYGELNSISSTAPIDSLGIDKNQIIGAVNYNGSISYAYGTKDPTSGVKTFDAAKTITDASDVWETTFTPVALTSSTLIEKVNFTGKTTSATETTFEFNELGTDKGSLLASVWSLDPIRLGGVMYKIMAKNSFVMYTFNEISIGSDGSLTLKCGLQYSSEVSYILTTTFSDIGTDKVPAGLASAITRESGTGSSSSSSESASSSSVGA